MTPNGKPAGAMIPLAGLYENTSQRTGKTYFTGYLGKAKLVMLEAKDAKNGEPQWTLFLAERPEKSAPRATSAEAPQQKRPFDDEIPL